ncbi:F-box associated domain containing protein [Tanacetum coccineum]
MGRLEDLPDEIMCDILSRLPVKSIITCKCICKKWENMVSGSYFVDLHMLRSPECLLIYQSKCVDEDSHSGILKLLEIEDQPDHNHLLREPFMGIDMADLFPGSLISLVGSVNGLVCLWESLWVSLWNEHNKTPICDNTYICNPITREYMILPKQQFDATDYWDARYGFGVSVKGEYKVIRILGDSFKIEVYTLGTDQWRSLEVPKYLKRMQLFHGIFFQGHVYWIVDDQLFSFDLDNETFKLFPFPPPPDGEILYGLRYIGILKGCLSLLCNSSHEITVWVMKEHGIEKFWKIKNCTLELNNLFELFPICLVDGLNGRSILMFKLLKEDDECESQLMAHCLETSTSEDTTISDKRFTVKTYRPSLMKLQNFQSSAEVHVF